MRSRGDRAELDRGHPTCPTFFADTSISEDEWGGGEDDEGIEEIDGGGVPLSPMAEEDEGSWGDEGAPDVMMTFDGENWVPRRSSFDASSI